MGIEYYPHPRNGLLRIYIDTKDGILVEDCTKVSHQVSGMLDVEDPISDNYQLEVSSPGADRPIFKISQFEQFIGSTVTVNLFKPINKQRKITGQIDSVDGEVILLQQADQTIEIPFQALSKARLVPEDLIKKGGRNGK